MQLYLLYQVCFNRPFTFFFTSRFEKNQDATSGFSLGSAVSTRTSTGANRGTGNRASDMSGCSVINSAEEDCGIVEERAGESDFLRPPGSLCAEAIATLLKNRVWDSSSSVKVFDGIYI